MTKNRYFVSFMAVKNKKHYTGCVETVSKCQINDLSDIIEITKYIENKCNCNEVTIINIQRFPI